MGGGGAREPPRRHFQHARRRLQRLGSPALRRRCAAERLLLVWPASSDDARIRLLWWEGGWCLWSLVWCRALHARRRRAAVCAAAQRFSSDIEEMKHEHEPGNADSETRPTTCKVGLVAHPTWRPAGLAAADECAEREPDRRQIEI